MQIVFLLTGIAIGAVVSWLYFKSRAGEGSEALRKELTGALTEKSVLADRCVQLTEQIRSAESLLESHREQVNQLSVSLAKEQTICRNMQERLDNQKTEIEELQKKFTTEFENLSSKILEEKSKKFTEQNRANLDIILDPLKQKIRDFEQKVEQSYKIESAERNTLKGEIKNLIELNKQISDEAQNLTRALKGDTKKQGNWGELILEKILERSGLTRGTEYDVQVSMQDEEGRRFQPDVIVYLPDNKHIIIDSKVSLIAYESMINCTDDATREQCLKEHIVSIRSHIKNLSEKSYQSNSGLTTPDFVLLFMPIESSFGLAIQADNELFGYAWDRKIVIVSPSTLLATLKTVSSIWNQEKQTRNALEIARLGGALYDKFKGFMDDMIEVGNKMNAAGRSYEEAMKKLSTGNGNIVRRIEELKKLGAKTTKELPSALVARAEENVEA